MSESLDIEALYGVLHLHLGHLCNGQVYPLIAPGEADYPIITYGFTGGGEEDRRRRDNSTLILTVKCIAHRLEETFLNARLIRDLLRDQGDQEGSTLPLDPEWRITTVSKGALVHLVEVWKDGTIFYHTGYDYEFKLERRTDG